MRRALALTLLLFPILAHAGPAVKHPLLAKASAEAKATGKLVYVAFSASWCGPCRKLHGILEHDPVKAIWDKQFVSVNVIVDENGDKVKLNSPGGDDLRKALGGDQQGIPFFAFLKPDGTMVGDSFMGPKQNIGCPMTPEEIAAFMKTLAKVAPKLTPAEKATIEKAFQAG